MDSSKKSGKPKFLPPGMLAKGQKKRKFSFGLPASFSTVGDEACPAKNLSNVMSSTVPLSQNYKVAPAVTTKEKNGINFEGVGSVKNSMKDLFEAGYQIEDVIEALGPELGKTVSLDLQELVSSISKEESIIQDGAKNWEEEENAHVTENTSIHLVDSAPVITKKKRITAPRGINLCTKVSKLEKHEKLQVTFVNNVPVGNNAKDMVRHMGKLIRDRHLIPRRIHSWKDIEDQDMVLEHLWQALIDKFDGEHMDLQRESLINHMKRLWQNWRGILKRDHINTKATIKDALKDVPNHLDEEEWEWLVTEHYMSTEFKRVSARNSKNRAGLKMLHRTGSRSIQDFVWSELGAKDGNQPSISEVFKRTRINKGGTLGVKETLKYDEIREVEKDEGLSRFDVIEKCFGPQDHSHVACFGRGTKPKDVRGPLASREELTRKLRDMGKENGVLIRRLDELEETRKREVELSNAKVTQLETLTIEKNAKMEKQLQILMALLPDNLKS